MLAFARHYELNVVQEWSEQYLRFAELEKLASEGIAPETFFTQLTEELARVEAFRQAKESAFSKQQHSIESLSPKYMKGKSRHAMAVCYLLFRRIIT